jgi:uncharacterized membrane-anchored protein YitT (DUF2179 family)
MKKNPIDQIKDWKEANPTAFSLLSILLDILLIYLAWMYLGWKFYLGLFIGTGLMAYLMISKNRWMYYIVEMINGGEDGEKK